MLTALLARDPLIKFQPPIFGESDSLDNVTALTPCLAVIYFTQFIRMQSLLQIGMTLLQ